MTKRLFIPCDQCGYEEFWETNYCAQCGSPIPRRTLEDLPPSSPPFNWKALLTATIGTTALLIALIHALKAKLIIVTWDAVVLIFLTLVLMCAMIVEMIHPYDERFEVTVGIAAAIIISYIYLMGLWDVMYLTEVWQVPFLVAIAGSALGRWLSRRRIQPSNTGTDRSNQ